MSNDYYEHSAQSVTKGATARADDVNNVGNAMETGMDKLPSENVLKDGTVDVGTDTGAVNAYVVAMTFTRSALRDGQRVSFKPDNTSTSTTVTINCDGLGAKSCKANDGGLPTIGDFVAGKVIDLVYESTSDTYLIQSSRPGTVTESAASVVEAQSAQSGAEDAQTAAETAQSGAETAEANAAAIYDDFDDRYLGPKASDPTLDNDGDALVEGAMYFKNTATKGMRFYNGSAWETMPTAPDASQAEMEAGTETDNRWMNPAGINQAIEALGDKEGNLVLLDSGSFSGASSFTLETELANASYDDYVLEIEDWVCSNNQILMQFYVTGALVTSSSYEFSQLALDPPNTPSLVAGAASTSLALMPTAVGAVYHSGRLCFTGVKNTSFYKVFSAYLYRRSATEANVANSEYAFRCTDSVGAVTGLKFTPNAGTLSGSWKLYGVKK